MRPKKLDIDPANVDTDGIADALGTGTSWSLSGDAEWLADNSGDNLAHRLGITTAGNEPGGNGPDLTLTGTDADGRVQTETVTLPNATLVETTKYFLTVASATADAATINTMDIGWVDEVASKTIVLDHYEGIAAVVGSQITGTLSYDVEVTNDNPIANASEQVAPFIINDQDDLAWVNDTVNVAKTANFIGSLGTPGLRAMRVILNSYTDTGEVQIFITQPNSR